MTTPGFSPRAGLWDWRDFTEYVLYCKRQHRHLNQGKKAICTSGMEAIMCSDIFPCDMEWNVQLIFMLFSQGGRLSTVAFHMEYTALQYCYSVLLVYVYMCMYVSIVCVQMEHTHRMSLSLLPSTTRIYLQLLHSQRDTMVNLTFCNLKECWALPACAVTLFRGNATWYHRHLLLGYSHHSFSIPSKCMQPSSWLNEGVHWTKGKHF